LDDDDDPLGGCEQSQAKFGAMSSQSINRKGVAVRSPYAIRARCWRAIPAGGGRRRRGGTLV